ncbi:MAG TPA: hypothetical protein PLW25_04005, partial [Anaerolineaceae bacterium]|nr:hypothetical protein [Anaerolineaceae bacterium]
LLTQLRALSVVTAITSPIIPFTRAFTLTGTTKKWVEFFYDYLPMKNYRAKINFVNIFSIGFPCFPPLVENLPFCLRAKPSKGYCSK